MTKKSSQAPKNSKSSFIRENFAGIVALLAVLTVALYVISTYFNMPVLVVPKDAVEITYPSSIFNENVNDMAKSMKGAEGVYRVNVNDDGSLTVKMSPEKYSKIVDAADNAVNSMTIISIGEETAIKDYSAENDHTLLKITVDPSCETLEKEIEDAVYTVRLYHACKRNNDVNIDVYYINMETDNCYKKETYDIDGNRIALSEGNIVIS